VLPCILSHIAGERFRVTAPDIRLSRKHSTPRLQRGGNIRRVYEGIRASFQGRKSLKSSSSMTAPPTGRQNACGSYGWRIRRATGPVWAQFRPSAALFAGLQAARGVAVITLDSDLQHPPEFLPRMLDAWRGGARVVQMVRVQTDGVGWFKRLSSSLFYWFLNLLSETPVVRGAADYQLLDREVVKAVLQFRDRQPFLRGLLAWLGFASVPIEYVLRPGPPARADTARARCAGLLFRRSPASLPNRCDFHLSGASGRALLPHIHPVCSGAVCGWPGDPGLDVRDRDRDVLGAVQLVLLACWASTSAAFTSRRGICRAS